MQDYFWISKLAHHPVFVSRTHPVLVRLARQLDVRVTVAGPDNMDSDLYVQAVYDAIESQATGIMIVGWGDREVIPAIEAADSAGIPVVTTECDIPNSRRLAHAGTDWYRMGIAMAEETARLTGGHGRVLLLGATGWGTVEAGFRGFQFGMTAYPEISVLQPEDDFDLSCGKACDTVTAYLRKYPDLAGIAGFSSNSGPGASLALLSAGRADRVGLVCVDADEAQLEHLRTGTINAAFAQKREAYTQAALQMLYNYNHGSAATGYRPGRVNIPGNIDTGFVVVTADNVDSFEEELGVENVYHRHELSQRLALVSSMIENSCEPAFATDADGRIVYANPAGLRCTGLSDDDLQSRSLDSLFDFTDRQRDLFNRCINEGKTSRFESTLKAPDGSVAVTHLSIAPLQLDHDARGTVVMVTNIGEARSQDSNPTEARQSLRESQRALATLMSNIPGMAYRCANDKHWTMEFVSEGCQALTGYTAEDLIGNKRLAYADLIEPEDRDRVWDEIQERLKSKRPFQIEYRIIAAGGERRWVWEQGRGVFSDNGDLLALEGLITDTTKRKTAEEALQQAELEKVTILDSLVEHVVYQDWNMKILWANKAACQSIGMKREELIGRYCHEVWVDSEERCEECPVYEAMRTGQQQVMEKTTPDDRTWFIRGYPVRNAKGDIIGGIELTLEITARIRVEQALRQSEATLHSLLHAAPIGIGRTSNRIIGWTNDRFSEIIGYEPNELLGMSARALYESDDEYERVGRVKHGAARKYGVGSVETRMVRKNGKVIDVLLSSSPLDPENFDAGLVFTVTDITQRRLAEKALRLTQSSIDNFADAVYWMTSDARFTFVNDAACDLLGYSREQLLNMSVQDIDPEFPSEMWPDHWQQLKEEGSLFFESTHRTKGGREFPVEITANYVKFEGEAYNCAIARDISERKQAQEALSNERERLSVTLRSIGDGVIATDTEGRVTVMNKVAEELTGWPEADALGRPLAEVFHIVDEISREEVENPVNAALETGVVIAMANHTVLIAPDGTQRTIADSGAPIKNRQGNIIGVVLVFRDITETRRLRDLAERAERLETAGRVAGQVAHDFNNLLAPLMAYPTFIRDVIPANDPAADYLEKIERAAEQMAEINQQLLTLGRRGHYAVKPVILNDIVNQVVKQLAPLPRTLALETNLADDLMPIKAGVSQIFRVISNLLSNSMESMENIGRLTITTENYYTDQPSGKYGRVPKGEYAKLTVSDTGGGIDREHTSRVFEPFFSTKTTDRRRGSGLGLSVVHAVVKDHHGYIDFESEPGRGTTFYLYFPVTREALDKPDDGHSEIPGGNERVMVVDDDPGQRDVTVTMLRRLGYQASAVESGEEAITFIRDNPQDLLILDMIMPGGLDGTETYRRIVEMYPGQKAIVVSGYAETERVNEAMHLGTGQFLRKPLAVKTLARAIRSQLDGPAPHE